MNFNNHPITSHYYSGGESLTYETADAKLQGRCKYRRKLANNTYLERNYERYRLHTEQDPYIAVRLHNTEIIRFYPDGRVRVNTGGWNTITTRDRLNRFMPACLTVHSERNVCFLSHKSTTPEFPKWNNGAPYHPWERLAVVADSITVNVNTGEVVTMEGQSIAEVLAEFKEQDRERRRLARWLRLGRPSKRISSGCTSARKGRGWGCGCHPRAFRAAPVPPAGVTCKCGCTFVRQTPPPKLTLAQIMDEGNITIRMAMIRAYGIDRFLLDAEAAVIDSGHGYELLQFHVDAWNRITALKMRCPSTSVVYISPVAPHVTTVPQALDWYFQTKDYLSSVTQQS
jgi:hypothetical protein